MPDAINPDPEPRPSEPVEIHLNGGGIALVDHDQLPLLNSFWTATRRGQRQYAHRKVDGKNEYLHHVVLPVCLPGMVRDHINGDGLDNRKANLRVVSKATNARNHARPSGIIKRGRRYRAQIKVDGWQLYLGTFATLEEAREVRRKAERDLWGEIQPRREHLHRDE